MGSCCGKQQPVPKPKSERQIPAPLQFSHVPRSEVGLVTPIDSKILSNLVRCQLYDDPNPPQCPYCERLESDKADMIICNSPIIPYDLFQTLMVRGWWRTGNVIFKPQVESVCCPSYAIRMSAADYQLSKAHRKVLNKWKNFLLHGDPQWENRKSTPFSPHEGIELPDKTLNGLGTAALLMDAKTEQTPSQPTVSSSPQKTKNLKKVRKGTGPDPNRPPCRKAKEVRAERHKERKGKQNQSDMRKKAGDVVKKTLLEVLEEHENEIQAGNPKHNLEIKVLSRDDAEVSATLRQFFDLYNRFQDAVHPGKSKFKTPADLRWGFINSPLEPQEEPRPLGTYHMKYYLDGELIMLSLIDILPEYLVSIYFIYDPDIRFLQPGIYTCIQEIALIQRLQLHFPELKYYNLGYYNDFSPKINYKRQFKPTEILCPVTHTYVPLEQVVPLLKEYRFCRFAQEEVPERPKQSNMNVDEVVVLYLANFEARYFCKLPDAVKPGLKPVLQHYMRETGEDVMKQMLVSR